MLVVIDDLLFNETVRTLVPELRTSWFPALHHIVPLLSFEIYWMPSYPFTLFTSAISDLYLGALRVLLLAFTMASALA